MMQSFVPETERIPGTRQDVRLQRQAGLASLPRRILYIGWRLSGNEEDDSASEHDFTAVRVRARSEVQSITGAGAQLDLMARAAFATGKLARQEKPRGGMPRVYIMPVPPPSAEADVAAVRTATFTGTANSAGPVFAYVAGETVSVQVAQGDGLSIIADRLASALARRAPDLPFTAVANEAVLTLEAREKGAWGNELVFHVDTSQVVGLKATLAAKAQGVGVVDLAPALAASLTDDWDAVVVPQDDPATRDRIKPHILKAWDFTRRRYRIVVVAQGGDFSDAQTAAAKINDWRVMVVNAEVIASTTPGLFHFKDSARAFSFEVAASMGTRLFTQERANYNYNKASLPVFGRPRTVNRDAVNESINAGVTVVVVPEGGLHPGVCVRPVSCAVTDQTGQTNAEDRTWQPIEIAKVVAFVMRQMDLELDRFTRGADANADEETRISAIAAAVAVLGDAQKQGLIANIDNDSVIASYSLVGGATHLIVALAYGVRVGVDIVAIQHNVSRAV